MIQTQDISDTRLQGTRGALYEMRWQEDTIDADADKGTSPGELGGGDTLKPDYWYLIVAAAERVSAGDRELFPLPAIPGSIFRTGGDLIHVQTQTPIDVSVTIHVYIDASARADAVAGVIPEEAVTGRTYNRHIKAFPSQRPGAVATWQALLDAARIDRQKAVIRVTKVTDQTSQAIPHYKLEVEIKRPEVRHPGATLKQGDRVKPFTIEKLCYALDISLSSTLEKIEATTQCDEAKTYLVSDRPEITGSVNGYFVDGSQAQQRLLKKFWSITTNDGGVFTEEKKSSTGVVHALLSRKEKTGSIGGYELWEYLPMVVDSITTDKPASGMQTFNYNFTIVGGSKPHVYRHKITQGATT